MTTLTVTTTDRQPAAVMRAEVPMEELRTVFDRGFGEVVRVAEAQGLTITGPPFGFYLRMPTDTVEVAVGFPVSTTVTPDGNVQPLRAATDPRAQPDLPPGKPGSPGRSPDSDATASTRRDTRVVMRRSSARCCSFLGLAVVCFAWPLETSPAPVVFLEVGRGCHVDCGSLTKLSCSRARVSVKTRLAVPCGRTTTTSNASARPRTSARRIVRRPARSRKQTPLRSRTTRLRTGARERRSRAFSTSGTAARSNSPSRRTCRVASDSSTATSSGLG